MTGLAVASFMQIGFLYLQFYVPFVAAFWLMYGGESGVVLATQTNTTGHILNHDDDLTDTEMRRLFTSLQKVGQQCFSFLYENLQID